MRLSDHYNFSHALRRLRQSSMGDIRRWISTIPAITSAPPSTDIITALCRVCPAITRAHASSVHAEVSTDAEFLCALDVAMQHRRGRKIINLDLYSLLYSVVRLLRPSVVFETGVFDGVSSAMILRAMARNKFGSLISIDLPARVSIPHSTDRMAEASLPPGCDPAWAVPSDLLSRHHLYLGDSKKLLPSLLKEYGEIDIFFHDSLHTYEHQMFEYEAAWPHLIPSGLLISDDVFWSAALHRFCKMKKVAYCNIEGGFGIVRKAMAYSK